MPNLIRAPNLNYKNLPQNPMPRMTLASTDPEANRPKDPSIPKRAVRPIIRTH
jgi:hypothetical protein